MPEQTAGPRRVAGRYVLGEALGHGGMGTVWRVEDELLGRSVAIKEVEIPATVPPDERAVARGRVLREARAAARLDHYGVVTIHDVIEDVGRVYIVMELVRAPNLAELVGQQGPLAPARVAAIGEQILDVLEAAHAAGIVHRDVKPANVMVLARDRVKLTDFGIASVHGDPQLTSAGVVLGSPAYMAPEQASGQPAGPPVDLWSLGATLYYAAEGRPPFRGDDPAAVLAAILTRDPEPPQLAGPLAPVLAGLLRRSPADRPYGGLLRELLGQVAANAVSTTAGDGWRPDVAATGPRAATTITSAPPAAVAVAGAAPAAPAPAAPATPEAPAPAPASPYASTGPAGPYASTGPAGPAVSTGPTAPVAGTSGPTAALTDPGAAAAGAAAGPQYAPVTFPDEKSYRTLPLLLAGSAGLLVVAVVVVALVLAFSGSGTPSARSGFGGQAAGGPSGSRGGSAGSSASEPTGAPASTEPPASTTSAAAPTGSDSTGTGAAPGALVPLDVTRVAPPGQLLPKFWASATNQVGGYRIGVPASFWRVIGDGSTTYAEWPGDALFNAAFEVHQYGRGQDPYQLLRTQSAAFARANAANRYTRLQLDPHATYRRGPAAAWEYTWLRNGVLTRARVVAFRAGSHTYTVLYRSKDLWWNAGGTAEFPDGFETALTPLR